MSEDGVRELPAKPQAQREEGEVHTRLLKCAFESDQAREYWRRKEPGQAVTADRTFEEYWFGAMSLPAVKVLLANFRVRFDAYPNSAAVLHRWSSMEPATRTLICHWHLQLADPLYRRFTGDYLPERRELLRPDVTRELVTEWVGQQGPGRWTLATRIQFASKLLSTALGAGLVATNRDPRALVTPWVPDDALTYLMYLLREVAFQGSLLVNPYLRSVGLVGPLLDDRLRGLGALYFQRQAELLDFGWRYPSLQGWFSQVMERTPGGAS